ncbi:histidine phosphatase family protein [Paractinoplanes globisporus]|uniref:Histidine phosphatase family protein n=1 Tax=Paractinoplanes globisporus TaxID=113565 RepID=A0ABW6WD39_9ACTN|nr:histidine phosphatase family protein [Actinoplanes globisporus]
MTTLHLVRHGQTPWHRPNRYTGSSDIGLDETGERQAEELADWAAGAGLTALACSDLIRAVRTAAPSAARAGLTPIVDKRLRELDFGSAEGRLLAEMPADVAARFVADPAENHFPGGEHPRDAVERAMAALGELAGAYPRGRILIVAHSTLIRLIVCAVLGVPLREYRRKLPGLSPASRTDLRFDTGSAALLAYNVGLTPGCAA